MKYKQCKYPSYFPKNWSVFIERKDCIIFFTHKGYAIHYNYKTSKKIIRKLFYGYREKLQTDPEYYKLFFKIQ